MAARALLFLLLTACSSFAYLAQASAQAVESYEGHVKDALEAQGQGDYERAHEAFAAAHALKPNARTLRGMGVASFQAGHARRALGELEAALAHPEKPLDDELRSAVMELLSRVRAQLGHVTVKITPADAHVRVDEASETLPANDALVLDPGSHTLRFEAEGHVGQSLGIDVAAGTSQTVRVSLTPETAPREDLALPQVALPVAVEGAPAPEAAPLRHDRLGKKTHRRKLIGTYTLLGLGAGAGITSLSVWLAGKYQRVAGIRAYCESREGGACSPLEYEAQLRDAHIRRFDRAVLATGIVGAGAAAFGIGLLTWDFYAEGKRLSLTVSAQKLALSGRF